VSRRIVDPLGDDLVVTITAEGIGVRWHGKRITATLPLGVLRDRLNAETVRSRKQAMKIAPPRGWCPEPRDEVFVSEIASPGCTVGRVRRVREAVPGPQIVVLVGPACRRRELTVGLDDVRPLPAALATPEPQRPLLG
jgi:hypothetical protein